MNAIQRFKQLNYTIVQKHVKTGRHPNNMQHAAAPALTASRGPGPASSMALGNRRSTNTRMMMQRPHARIDLACRTHATAPEEVSLYFLRVASLRYQRERVSTPVVTIPTC